MFREFCKLLILLLLAFKITALLCQTVQVRQEQKNEAIKANLKHKKLTFIRFPQTTLPWIADSGWNKSVLTIYYRITPETIMNKDIVSREEEMKMKRNYSNDTKQDGFKLANPKSQSNVIQLIMSIMTTIIVLCILIKYYYNKSKNGHYNLLAWNKVGRKSGIIYTI